LGKQILSLFLSIWLGFSKGDEEGKEVW